MTTLSLSPRRLRLVRWLTAGVIAGLVLAGATALPLRCELEILARGFAGTETLDPAGHTGLTHWILKVREGLVRSYESYPFLAYGTDWLAFGHFVIALFFIPVLRDPLRYRANVWVGLAASILVFPLAFGCGPVRGIPVFWRLIDCSFGLGSGILFAAILRLTRPSAAANAS